MTQTGIIFSIDKDIDNESMSINLHEFEYEEGRNTLHSSNVPTKYNTTKIDNINFNSLVERTRNREKIINLIKKELKENPERKIFVQPKSEEYALLKSDPQLSKKIGVVGAATTRKYTEKTTYSQPSYLRRKHNKPTPEKAISKHKAKLKKQEVPFIQPKISDDKHLHLEFDVEASALFKAYQFSLVGFNSRSRYINDGEKLINKTTIMQNNEGYASDTLIKHIIPEIKLAQSKEQKVVIHHTVKNNHLAQDIRNELAKLGLTNCSFELKSRSQINSKDTIEEFMTQKFHDIHDLSNKVVVYCDGSEEQGRVGSGFVIRQNDTEDMPFAVRARHLNTSTEAEIFAFTQSLRELDKLNLKGKDIYYVFDSDYVFMNISKRMNGDRSIPNIEHFDEAISLLEQLDCDFKSVVVKSHVDPTNAINNDHRKIIQYNDQVDALAKQGKNKI